MEPDNTPGAEQSYLQAEAVLQLPLEFVRRQVRNRNEAKLFHDVGATACEVDRLLAEYADLARAAAPMEGGRETVADADAVACGLVLSAAAAAAENAARRSGVLQRLVGTTASLLEAEAALAKYAEVNMSVADELEREGHCAALVTGKRVLAEVEQALTRHIRCILEEGTTQGLRPIAQVVAELCGEGSQPSTTATEGMNSERGAADVDHLSGSVAPMGEGTGSQGRRGSLPGEASQATPPPGGTAGSTSPLTARAALRGDAAPSTSPSTVASHQSGVEAARKASQPSQDDAGRARVPQPEPEPPPAPASPPELRPHPIPSALVKEQPVGTPDVRVAVGRRLDERPLGLLPSGAGLFPAAWGTPASQQLTTPGQPLSGSSPSIQCAQATTTTRKRGRSGSEPATVARAKRIDAESDSPLAGGGDEAVRTAPREAPRTSTDDSIAEGGAVAEQPTLVAEDAMDCNGQEIYDAGERSNNECLGVASSPSLQPRLESVEVAAAETPPANRRARPAFLERYRRATLAKSQSQGDNDPIEELSGGGDVVSDSQGSGDGGDDELLGSQFDTPGFKSSQRAAAPSELADPWGEVDITTMLTDVARPNNNENETAGARSKSPRQPSPCLSRPPLRDSLDDNQHASQMTMPHTIDMRIAHQVCDSLGDIRWRRSTQCTPDVRCTADTAVSQTVTDLSGTPPLTAGTTSTGDTEVLPQRGSGGRRSQSTQPC
eukprot:jgi/Tetstr1/461425/TSEL_006535.t1